MAELEDKIRESVGVPVEGSNNPPLKDRIETRNEAIFERIKELTADAAKIAATIEDDKTCGDVQDTIKMMRKAYNAADAARDAEKEPFADAVKLVNATFLSRLDPFEALIKDLHGRTKTFLEAKKAREAARLAEIARKEREEREKKAKEAAEAEERRKAAEAAAAKAKADAEEAERRAAKAKADAEEAEKRAREAKEANDREEARQDALRAKSERDRAIVQKVEAQAAEREAKDEEREANKEAVILTGDAVRAEKRAEKIDAAIEDGAGLSRTRGDMGTVGSLAKRWTYRVVNYNAIPLEDLRAFLHRDAIDAAIFRAMQTGVRKMPGVVFEEVEEARIA